MKKLLERAKAKLVLHHPYYAAIVLGLPLIRTDEVPTAATDGAAIYCNHDFMAQLTDDEQVFVLAHEAEHVVRLHSFRCKSRDHKRFNIAADHLINLDLIAAGFTLPRESIIRLYHAKEYRGMYTEQVYNLIPEDAQDDSGMAGDVKPAKGSEAEQQAAEQRAKQIIHQAAESAKQAGELPKHVQAQLDELLKPAVKWQEVLQRFMTEAIARDESWAALDRRVRHMGLRLPTLDGFSMGEIAVVIDVSGSCYDEIPQFLGEIAAIVSLCAPSKLHILWTDSQVMRHDEVTTGEYATIDKLLCDVSYGGGTDMTSAFRFMEAQAIEPVVAVVLTDGYTDFGTEPEYPVLWCMSTDEVAPWGETLRMAV